MSENTNELNELLEDVKMIVQETLDDEWSNECQRWDFDSSEEYEAYGDTFVSSGSYITENSENKFREYFKDENQPEYLIKKLQANPDFVKCLKDLVKEYVQTKELEV